MQHLTTKMATSVMPLYKQANWDKSQTIVTQPGENTALIKQEEFQIAAVCPL